MTAKLCTLCGATVIPATGANGKPIELDASVPVCLAEIDREPARPVAFWAVVGQDHGRVEHKHVCKGRRS